MTAIPATLRERSPATAWQGRCAVGIVLLTWLAQACIIWTPTYPPLVDLPDHMARHYLEAQTLAGQPLPDGYAVVWGVLPNLGGDFLIPLLLLVMSPLTAAKGFLTLSVWLYWLGP